MKLGVIPTSWSPYLLGILHIVTGLLFLSHGSAKDAFKGGVPLSSLVGISGILELVGGLLIALGLFTRSVAFCSLA